MKIRLTTALIALITIFGLATIGLGTWQVYKEVSHTIGFSGPCR
ncbi:MAG: hypothetical protein AAB364_02525 [Patescibacteria group bacterium]